MCNCKSYLHDNSRAVPLDLDTEWVILVDDVIHWTRRLLGRLVDGNWNFISDVFGISYLQIPRKSIPCLIWPITNIYNYPPTDCPTMIFGVRNLGVRLNISGIRIGE